MTDKAQGFVITINQRLCYGCGDCIQQCPERVLGFMEDTNPKGVFPAHVYEPALCKGCRKCQTACRYGMIDIETAG